MKIYSLLFAFFTFQLLVAQQYTGAITKVEKDGFYTIRIASNVAAAMHNNFNYFRIKNSKNQEVPYTFFTTSSISQTTDVPLDVFEKKVIKDAATIVILENKLDTSISEFSFAITATDVEKEFSISGSNDKENWYGIKEKIKTATIEKRKENGNNLYTMSFPEIRYKYLKVVFTDKKSLPINFISAKTTKLAKKNNSEFTTLKQPKVETFQDAKNKKSYIKISFDETQCLSKISFKIKNSYFLREAKLYRIDSNQKRNYLNGFRINSKVKTDFLLANIIGKNFEIELFNNDNPPLEIEHIDFYYQNSNLLTELKGNENYTFSIDTLLQQPNYDLSNFNWESKENYPLAQIESLKKTTTATPKLKESKLWEQPWVIWICILLAGSVIVYFAMSLLKDVNKN